MIFLLKWIVNFTGTKVDPVIKEGRFINLKVNYGPNKRYYLNFKDSFLLLPVSLRTLAKTFNNTSLKTIFPHDFVNGSTLDYAGPVPGYNYFDNSVVTLQDYNDYEAQFDFAWSVRFEAIKYCEQDCKALYEVIYTFSKFIFDKFKINVSSVATLPSLAFKIFRANFLPKGFNLPVLTGKIYKDISNAFYGGHVDMYIPTNPVGTVVFEYDINALYPYAMKENTYPGKIFAYFRGDITKMTEYVKLFNKSKSILKVKVVSPEGLENQILPVKINGITVYPEGTWTDWYCCSDINNAINYGYQFEILEGYLFEPTDIFSSYVETINKIKQNSPSDSPWYTIAKLLLNSLFGRFGMKPNMLVHEVINTSDLSIRTSDIGLDNMVDQIKMGNKTLISFQQDFPSTPMINVAIASAITANARVFMSQFKNHPEIILLYSDTDSLFVSKPLPDHFIDDKKIGMFKLVRILSSFVALGTKVYGGIDLDGNDFTKTKGLKTKVSFSDLENLLYERNKFVKLEHKKQFLHLKEGTISVRNIEYSLRPTEDKRNLIYKNGKLVGTSNKIINK